MPERLDPHFRRVLQMIADCERPRDPFAVVTASRTAVYDGQAWVNARTASALARRGLVEIKYDQEGDLALLTPDGRAVVLGEQHGGSDG